MEDDKEVKAHVLTPDQTAEWGNDLHMVEPGQEQEEENDETQEQEEQTEEVEQVEQEEYTEPEPVVTVQDPGDYVPQDYSFEVTVYDDEGKKPKTVKIKSPDQWDELLDTDPNLGSSSALLKAQRLATKMESNLERDEREWKSSKEKFDAQVEEQNSRQQTIAQVGNEIAYLVSKGKLPQVDKQYESADWSDPQVAKQPGVKEQIELLNYWRKENTARRKLGLSDISVSGAFAELQLEKRDKQAQDVTKQAGEARKAAGARIAGNSPTPVANVPKGIMVGRAGSLRDLDPGW